MNDCFFNDVTVFSHGRCNNATQSGLPECECEPGYYGTDCSQEEIDFYKGDVEIFDITNEVCLKSGLNEYKRTCYYYEGNGVLSSCLTWF